MGINRYRRKKIIGKGNNFWLRVGFLSGKLQVGLFKRGREFYWDIIKQYENMYINSAQWVQILFSTTNFNQ